MLTCLAVWLQPLQAKVKCRKVQEKHFKKEGGRESMLEITLPMLRRSHGGPRHRPREPAAAPHIPVP